MTDDLRFERLTRDWLELGPVVAPDDAVQAALFEIDTTPQERGLRVPWRFPTMTRLALVAAAATLVALLGIGVFAAGSRPTPTPGPTSAPAVVPPPGSNPPTSLPASAAPTPDTSPLRGQLLVEHFGNAPDGSETGRGADVHRLYLADPNNLTRTGYTEFLPGTPSTGKLSADVSPDGTRVVFEDWADPSAIYIANIDGTGFRKLTPDRCGCSEWDPAFDPSGSRIVYGHAEGARGWLEIRDLATGVVTKLARTESQAPDDVPEAPSWSPDGDRIAFVRLNWNGVPATMGRVHYHTGVPTEGRLTIIRVGDETLRVPPAIPNLFPGDPDWSPDGQSILFTNAPTTIFDDSSTDHRIYTFKPDSNEPFAPTAVATTLGNRMTQFQGDSANFTPDGRILSTSNFFTLIRPDGTGMREVDPDGTDNTEDGVGYIYVGHWVGTP